MKKSFLKQALVAGSFLSMLMSTHAQAVIVEAQAVRGTDGTVQLTWISSTQGEPVTVHALENPEAPASRKTLVASNVTDNRYTLPAGRPRTHFLLTKPDGSSFRVAERTVALTGATNFRDIGGYGTSDGRNVRWGLIYRSSDLAGLSGSDFYELQRLNLKTVYDLRSRDERATKPTNWQGPNRPNFQGQVYDMDMRDFMSGFRNGVTVENAHVVMTTFYPKLIDSHRRQFKDVFEELLEMTGDDALMYHCTAGKDRTGVQTALILSALGVPRETILADFELSNRYYKPKPAAQASGRADPMAQLPPEVMNVLMGVDRRYLQAFFTAVEAKYGSVETYLNAELNVSAEDLAALRNRYTK